MSASDNMDSRIVRSLILLFIVIDIAVGSSSIENPKFWIPTVPTELTSKIPDQISQESVEKSLGKVIRKYRTVPNDSYEESDDNDDNDIVDGAPPDHHVPYSEHEDPDEPSTKPKYTKPGDWAKPPPDRDIPLDFVPTKIYAQVRGIHTVKHVPREEALQTAETAEEILAAPRLREVVSKSKKNTVYTEEGYEDSAYDHAGHVRDADFHEGFAKKLEDQQKSKTKPKKEYIRNNDDHDDDEFSEYDDDYRDHTVEPSKIKESKILESNIKEDRKDLKSIRNLWKNSDINPKQITENEIEKLENDLENEYQEAEKNDEKDVPENLENSGNDEDEEEESSSEEGAPKERNYGKETGESAAEFKQESNGLINNPSAEKEQSKNLVHNIEVLPTLGNPGGFKEFEYSTNFPGSSTTTTLKNLGGFKEFEYSTNFPGSSTTTTLNPGGLERFEFSTSFPEGSTTTVDYGKIFWDYFKSIGDKTTPGAVSTLSDVTTISTAADTSTPEILSSLPTFEAVAAKLGKFGTLNSPSNTEVRDFVSSTRIVEPFYPSAASIYESWRRRDQAMNSGGSSEVESFESDSYASNSDESPEADTESSLNLRNDHASTTVVSPKKLSYTVIIRSADKTTTKGPPCDREHRESPDDENSLAQLANPRYKEMLTLVREEVTPEVVKEFGEEQALISIRPPISAGHATYTDYQQDPYGVHSGVTQESGHLEEEVDYVRAHYNAQGNPYENRGQHNHISHPPSIRLHRGPPLPHVLGHKRNYHRRPPSTRLIPPSPIRRSKYADYLGIKRNEKFNMNQDRTPRADGWSNIIGLYRSIDRRIFGKRRRRSSDLEDKNSPLTNVRKQYLLGKVNGDSVNALKKRNLRPRRNYFHEEVNRLVTPDPGTANPSNEHQEKSSVTDTKRRRNDEDLLNESPKIAEEMINTEIASRFNDEKEKDDEDSENYKSIKQNEKTEVEVPEFNYTEVIENNKRQKVISSHPSKEETLDIKKYPFYNNANVPRNSALRYVKNPHQVPRKTLGGTEFYDSRDKYRKCGEVEPNLESVEPEEEEPLADREPTGDKPRLHGLGDKLDCFRAKYFDENPLDNPLFLEKQVGQPQVPKELNPTNIASNLFSIPSDEDEGQVVRRISRKPEVYDLRRSGSTRNQVSQEDYKKRRRNKGTTNLEADKSINNHRGRSSDRDRRRRKPIQTTTELPQLQQQVTPYEKEVYEDVMGTIKNLAGMYQTFGEPDSTPSIHPNVNHITEQQDRNFPVVHITERPRGFLLHGLLPPPVPQEPQTRQRYRIIPYRTNKVSYRTRARTETPPGSDGVKVGYFRTVRVHKRSIDDDQLSDLETGETRNISTRPDNSTSEGDGKTEGSKRVVYTIRDRIRHSKPRDDFGRHGKFGNLEAAGTENIRRLEPTYNKIRRKKVPASTDDPLTTTYHEGINENEPASTLRTSTGPEIKTGRQDFHDEPGEIYKIQYSTTQGKQAPPNELPRREDEEPANSQEYESAEENDEKLRKEKPGKNNYDVHEKIEGDTTTITSLVEPTGAPEFYELQTYLSSDPPGYSKAFTEKFTEPTIYFEEVAPTKAYEGAETRKETESDDGDNEEDDEKGEQVERPSESYTDEESESSKSEEAENESKNDGNDEPDEEASPKDEESSHDGEKEFIRFTSRPYSPFESYDDPKYYGLGPRLSKPAFHHPTFEKPKLERYQDRDSREYSAESEEDGSGEEDKGRSRYIFPWEEDEPEESKTSETSLGRYEYPWERRERLAKERRIKERKRREHERLYGFSVEEGEEDELDASNSELLGRRVHPWKHDVITSKIPESEKVIDNQHQSSDFRPVTRFSSRYNARSVNLADDEDPIVVSGAVPSEIKLSIIKSIDKAIKPPESKVSTKLQHINTSVATSLPFTTSVKPTTALKTSPRRPRNWNARSIIVTAAPTTTIQPTPISRKARIWRVASAPTTTKKPIRSRKRFINVFEDDVLKSGTQIREVAVDSNGINQTKSTTVPTNGRKIRRRGNQSLNRLTQTTTTVRPVRRRFQKLTTPPKESEESTGQTTPKTKTVEHRSRFSKEERITKTSYPQSDDDNDDDNNSDGTHDKSNWETKNSKDLGNGKNMMNETVEKVSIVTKETPDHIYRTEEIDKDGVKGMFVSITPNNGTIPSMDSVEHPDIDTDEDKEMMKRFETFGTDEDGPVSSVIKDVSLPPHNGAMKLSEHGTRNVVSSVSWISENYDY